jgi:hypothetical protein
MLTQVSEVVCVMDESSRNRHSIIRIFAQDDASGKKRAKEPPHFKHGKLQQLPPSCPTTVWILYKNITAADVHTRHVVPLCFVQPVHA